MDKKQTLKKEMLKWEALNRIFSTKDYQLYLKPILEGAFTNIWPDPTKASSYEEFHKQYSEQYGRAMAYKEIFSMLEGAGRVLENLTKQVNDPDKNYAL